MKNLTLKKILGYLLIVVGFSSIVVISLILSYLLFIAFIFCPIQSCWVSRIGIIVIEIITLVLGFWMIQQGNKLIRND